MAESPNFHVIKEIGAEEHDVGVRFKSGSGNMAVSCMRPMHPDLIIGTVRSLWTWLGGDVTRNVFLVET